MNLRFFLPFERYTLKTKLSSAEVCKLIADNIEPEKAFRFPNFNNNSRKLYEGNVFANTFKISRIKISKGYLPIIEGEILSCDGQTEIDISMRLMTLESVSWWIFLSVSGLVVVGILLTGLLQIKQIVHDTFSLWILSPFLIPLTIFFVGCFIPTLHFKSESIKSKEFLVTLLNGQENS
jgi:hypothetical protein